MSSSAIRKASWQGMNWVRPSTRLAIYLRDGMACVYCGASVEDGAQLTLDHVKPHSKGGTNDPSNLVTCCHKCNCSRSDRGLGAFARTVAGYINHGIKAEQIIAYVRRTTRRALPRAEARDLLARRGTVAAVVRSKRSR